MAKHRHRFVSVPKEFSAQSLKEGSAGVDDLKEGRFELCLLGAFQLRAPGGERVQIRSKKAIALLAMLATAERGERTRQWLQDKLWGSRGMQQAQYSLRRELSSLRKVLNGSAGVLLEADLRSVRLALDRISVDVRQEALASGCAEFLEGLDLGGEEGFEAWLRSMRTGVRHRRAQNVALRAAPGTQHAQQAPGATRGQAPTLALAVAPIRAARPDCAELLSFSGVVINRLVRFIASRKWLPVLAPADSTASHAASSEHGAAASANAAFVLETELTTDGSDARLLLMLKGDSGQRLLWSGSLPIGSKVDPEGLQENIGRFSCNLAVEVYYAETARIRALAPEDLGAAELTHLARQAVGQVSPGSAEIDRSLIERAMALGPTTAELVILDNFGKVIAVMSLESGECFASDMRTWASNAISADPTDWRGPLLASYVELWAGNFEAALAHGRNAHALCPYNPVIIGHLGATYVAMNEPEKALPELDFALSLSRFERQPYAILCNLALANLLLGRFEQALSLCEQASSCIPEFGLAYVLKIEALVAMGRTAEAARTYLDEVLGVHDSMIARLREHRVMPSFHIPAAEKALAAAVAAVAAVEDLDGADRLSPAANGRAFG